MTLEKIIEDKNFLKLLDEENSYKMAIALANASLPLKMYEQIYNMFKDLNIFQDIAMYGCDTDRKYKFILKSAFAKIKEGTTIDARGSYIFYRGIDPRSDCEILVDSGTTIENRGIYLVGSNFKLVLQGIPACSDGGIFIFGNTTTIWTDNKIYSQVEQMIDDGKIDIDNDEVRKNMVIF